MKKFSFVLVFSLVAFLFSSVAVFAADLELGVAWFGKSGMAKRVLQGLEQGFADLGVKTKLDLQKELASIDDLAKVTKDFQSKYKGQVILRSNAAKWLGKNPPAIPTFIGACNHPGSLGAVKNLKAPEGNVTGVTYFLPVETEFEVFKAVLPELKSVLLLLEKGHAGSPIDREGTKETCAKLGIAYNEAVVSSVDEAVAAAKANSGKVSAIIIGTQAMLLDNADKVVAVAGNTPVLSYSNKPVQLGALAGFAADDFRLGKMLAESVVEVLIKGKGIKDVAVKFDPKPNFFVNAKMVEKLGLEIPYEILESAKVIE
jgi:putative ABC transport system substrate-binding protein